MSTPSDTIRTATSQRLVLSANSLMRPEDPGSSDSTTVGASVVNFFNRVAYARAAVRSEAMIMPPASGT
jgi:hypothetical protein